jgi:hypothetical protein
VNDAVLAELVGSIAPTLAALLAYTNARAARRANQRANLAGLGATVDGLRQSVARTEAATSRIETAVTGLRERTARIEGWIDRDPARVGNPRS